MTLEGIVVHLTSANASFGLIPLLGFLLIRRQILNLKVGINGGEIRVQAKLLAGKPSEVSLHLRIIAKNSESNRSKRLKATGSLQPRSRSPNPKLLKRSD